MSENCKKHGMKSIELGFLRKNVSVNLHTVFLFWSYLLPKI